MGDGDRTVTLPHDTVVDAEPGTTTAERAIGESELARGRRMHAMMLAVPALVSTLILVRGDRSTLAMWTLAAMGVGAASSLLTLLLVRKQEDLRAAWIVPLNAPQVIPAIAACYYFGFFSAVMVVAAVSLYAMASSSRGHALLTYGITATAAGSGMFAIALGIVPDRGLLHADLDRPTLVVLAGSYQFVLLGIFLFGRQSAAAMRQAVADLERALREVDRRDALLGEANQDLERVLHAPAGHASGTFAGRWRLKGILGRGGMGEVYEAQHQDDGRTAAVKLLPAEAARDPELVERFRREATALARIDHPNVVRLFEVGDTFLAMELLEGSDLAAILRKRRSLPMDEALELLRQIADGLEAARAADVVHRDVKPQNIFLVEGTGRWKLLDFGVSKLGGATTLTQNALGTPAYMAPEQIKGEAVDHRTDVFAFGLVAYRVLTGQPAFRGVDNANTLFDALYMQPIRPGGIAALPDDVDLALALAIAKAPEDRLARAVDLAEAIARASRGELGADLRARGAKLVEVHPWGERIER